MANDKIRVKDVIEDEVFQIGEKFAKSLDPALKAQKEWIESFIPIKKEISTFFKLKDEFKISPDRAKFLESKKAEEEARKATALAVKAEQEALAKKLKVDQEELNTTKKKIEVEIKNERAIQATIDTEKKRLSLAAQKERAQKKAIKLTAQERLDISILNRNKREAAKISSKLTTAYEKQSTKLIKLKREYKGLAISEGESSKQAKKLRIEIQQLDGQLKRVDASVGDFQRNVGNYEKSLKGLGGLLRSLTSAFGFTSGILIFADLMRNSINTIKEFNSGLLNVSKTTGLAKGDLKKLGDEIVNLSNRLKTVGVQSLLDYATVAGQLGVKGTNNILNFTEALAKLETASDIAGEEGGAKIARLLTLTDGGVQNVSDFGDEIVILGNNFAATEGEILSNATAIAQNTGLYKLGRQQVLAYAVATKAAGLESELTGSTIGKTLSILEKSLRTGQNVQVLSELTGKSIEELKSQFRDDAGGVFTSLVEGLNSVDKSGGSVNKILEEIGVVGIRDKRVLGTLATAGFGTLEKSINDVAGAYGSLDNEFNTASTKLENQTGRVGIAFDNLVLSIENGDGAVSKFVVGSANSLANALNSISIALDSSEPAFVRYKNYLESVIKLGSPISFVISAFTEKNEGMKTALEQSTVQIQRQNEAFIDLHGSLAPLTEEQQKVIDNQEKINILFNGSTDSYGKNSETINELKEQIQTLNDELGNLQTSDEAGIKLKKAEIKLLRDRLNLLIGTTKVNKSAAKAERARLKAEKKLVEDLFKLREFSLKARINSSKEGVANELLSFDIREQYLIEQTQLELELALLSAKNKFDIKKKFTDAELETLLSGGELSVESQKKVSNEELLIIKKFQAERARILNNESTGKLNLDVGKLKAEVDKKLSIQKAALEKELLAENEFFQREFALLEDKEQAIEDHERRVADIKIKYAKQGLQAQISSLELLVQSSLEGSAERIKAEEQLATAKRELSDITTNKLKENDKIEVLSTEEKVEQILNISSRLASAIVDLANAILDGKIQALDAELDANDEKYNRYLENENLSEEQRKNIEARQKKDRERIQKEKEKLIRKQALINKAQTIVDIALATALGIMQAYAQTGPIAGTVGAALIAGLGAIQTAAVIATPIPQYFRGTDNHPGGLAEVGEIRPEVVTEPGKRPYVVSNHQVLDLPKGTVVNPSLEDYKNMMRNSTMRNLAFKSEKLNDFKTMVINSGNDELIDEMKLTRKAIEKKKTTFTLNQTKSPDIPHEFFRYNNTNWHN